jgi:ADP-ribosylglycohydrolase
MQYEYDEQYVEKTWSGWMGKIIGIRLGSPIEGWTYAEIAKRYGTIDDYVKDYSDYAADDDSNGPLFFIRAMMDYQELGQGISPTQMAETWLNYVADGHGFFWWGGYGISTEHTAYENLKAGIPAPESGSSTLNGTTIAQQIGGQIFIDSWGFVFPANPLRAATFAAKMIGVSHDGEGLYGGMFVTACISAAYVATSLGEIIEGGLSVLPLSCQVRDLVDDLLRFHQAKENTDWRVCFSYVQEHYGYDRYPGTCHILPNLAVVVLSLLYGEGDFSTSLSICNTCGWDTDCNAGNIGSILGVFVGIEGIEKRWTEPIKDLLLSSSVVGNLNITTVSQSALGFASLGCRLAGVDIPKRYALRNQLVAFDLPRSTGAMRLASANTHLQNCSHEVVANHRSLCVKNDTGKVIDLFYKTYYTPADLEDSRYDPAFSPLVFPGQVVEFLVKNCCSCEIEATVYAYDYHGKKRLTYGSTFLGALETKTVSTTLPGGLDVLISQVGLKIEPQSNISETCIYLDHLSIKGEPDYRMEFEKEQVEVFSPSHRELGGCTYSGGAWEYCKTYLQGSCSTKGNLFFGYYLSRDTEYSVSLTPQTGFYHLIDFRVQGAARMYSFGFHGEGKVALLKKRVDDTVLAECDFSYTLKRKYRMKVVVQGGSIVCFLDGKIVLTVLDDNPYAYGQMGLSVKHSSRCLYQSVVVKGI